MPSVFNAAAKRYDEVPLQISFRSAPAILEAVDAVFEHGDVRKGVSSEPVQHFPNRPRVGEAEKIGRVEVWKLEEIKKDQGKDEGWALCFMKLSMIRQAELAIKIAGQNCRLAEKPNAFCPGAQAPIAAGDIMVLLRRRGRFADLMVRALKERDVPVTGVDRMCLVKQLPVMDLLGVGAVRPLAGRRSQSRTPF